MGAKVAKMIGAGDSKVTPIPWQDGKLQRTKDMAGLKKKDIHKLRRMFATCDRDSSNTINIDEFHQWLSEPKTAFTARVFELFDCDGGSNLDFAEFVTAITSYCMFGEEEILKFCFVVFDSDGSGYIEGNEMDALVTLLHQTDSLEGNIKTAMDMIDTDGDGRIHFDEFAEMNKRFPTLLFPAFRIQANMQRMTFGDEWWANQRGNQHGRRDRFRSKAARLRAFALLEVMRKRKRLMLREEGCAMGTLAWFNLKHMSTPAREPRLRKEPGTGFIVVDKDTVIDLLGVKKQKQRRGERDAEGAAGGEGTAPGAAGRSIKEGIDGERRERTKERRRRRSSITPGEPGRRASITPGGRNSVADDPVSAAHAATAAAAASELGTAAAQDAKAKPGTQQSAKEKFAAGKGGRRRSA
jgi:Ca2+-binding EF-hand superfamily protein